MAPLKFETWCCSAPYTCAGHGLLHILSLVKNSCSSLRVLRINNFIAIDSTINTPLSILSIDKHSIKGIWGHFVYVQIDLNMLDIFYDHILVEREGLAFLLNWNMRLYFFFCDHCVLVIMLINFGI